MKNYDIISCCNVLYREIYCSLHLNIYSSEANRINKFLFSKIVYLIRKFDKMKSLTLSVSRNFYILHL